MKKPTKSRKGFIFTLLVLVIIVFMIEEINIYFRTFELQQQSEPTKVRTQVLETIASQFSSDSLTNLTSISVYAALYNLSTDYSNPPSFDPSYANLANVTWTLAWNGTR